MAINFQKQDSLPTRVHNIGPHISDSWETETWVQSISYFRELKSALF